MKRYKLIILLGFIFFMPACSPRIEMDMSEWGDHAFINNVQLFKLEVVDDVHLQEWYEDGQAITGIRQIIISSGTAVVDDVAFTVTVKLKSGESLSEAGLLIYHYGTSVEPMNGSPKAGIVTDLSAGLFVYRIHSADGSQHDWTININ